MSLWEWDLCLKLIPKLHLKLDESARLPETIDEFSFARAANHQLMLVAKSKNGARPQDSKPRVGEVYRSEDSVPMQSAYGKGRISGLKRIRSVTNIQGVGGYSRTDSYELQDISFDFSAGKEVLHTIDYVANIPRSYIWLGNHEELLISTKRASYAGEPPIIFEVEEAKASYKSSSIRIRVGGYDLVIGKYEASDEDAQSPGYILYQGNPDGETRKQIRYSLSFAFGSPLVFFGSASFCKEGRPTSLLSVSAQTVNGRAWDIVGMPPAPITVDGTENVLDAGKVQRVAQGIKEIGELYGINVLCWRLWYAESAAYFMRPAYYGAFIEGIQKRYLEGNEEKISHTIVDRNVYKPVRKRIERLLTKLALDSEADGMFRSKLNNGNSAPQKVVSQRFYATLNLELGRTELDAWNKRNDAAHGNEISEAMLISFIRETKVLKVILNRILLRLTAGSDEYIDYFTYGHPSRLLAIPIPDDSDT